MRWLLALTAVGCGPGAAPARDARPGWVPELPDRAAYIGCESTSAQDLADDGKVDLTEHTVYDALGWESFVERTAVEHGSSQTESWTGRNAWGLFERHDFDANADGHAEVVDEGGYEDHLWTWTTLDEGGDGALEWRALHTNADGVRVWSDIDEGDDGHIDVGAAYTYDADWRLLRDDRDRFLDGTTDEYWQTTWEGAEAFTVHEDEVGDNEAWRAAYDDAGRLVSWAYDDLDADYATELVYAYSDASSALVARIDVTVWEEQVPYYTATWTYTHDSDGRVLSDLRTYTFDSGATVVDRAALTWSCPAR